MERVDLFGAMAASMKAAGIAASKVESDTILTSTESSERATGSMVDVKSGWTMMEKRSEPACSLNPYLDFLKSKLERVNRIAVIQSL